MKWFNFDQNNSGGSFVRNEGVDCDVFIQAPSFAEALVKAEAVGIYFDGCENGVDCGCCGDRWSRPFGGGDELGDELPSKYGEAVVDGRGLTSAVARDWSSGAVFHFADGRVLRSYENVFGQAVATPADFSIFDAEAPLLKLL